MCWDSNSEPPQGSDTFEGHLGKGECRGSGVQYLLVPNLMLDTTSLYWKGHVATGMICALPHHLPGEETLLIDKHPHALSRGMQQKLLGEKTRKLSSVFQASLKIRLCANKSGDTSLPFTLNKLLFHRRTEQDSGNKLCEVLGTIDITYLQLLRILLIYSSCSSILVLSNSHMAVKGRGTQFRKDQDTERFGSHCARHLLACCEANTGGATTGANYMG